MHAIDLRQCLNAISDVVNNRPRPLREFDQIYMKSADMLLQVEHVARCFDKKRILFMGDGDAIGLCLAHLYNMKLLEAAPECIHVMDFDERVVFSIMKFAERFDISDRVTAEVYNVADPLPAKHWQKFHGFYTNPPFGQSNGGRSVESFIKRGIEAIGMDAVACIVIADHPNYDWTQEVLLTTEKLIMESGFIISELLPKFHHYHLDDAPDLTSCSMLIRRVDFSPTSYDSIPLSKEMLEDFYGKESPLRVKYIRDLTLGGKMPSKDHRIEPLEGDD